jgi:hypothetical protein
MADFEYKDTIDYKKLDEFGKSVDEILIGYPTGMLHDNGFDPVSDMAEDARKLSFGTGDFPARPFLEDGLEAGKQEVNHAIEMHYKTKLENGKGNLDRIAAVAVASIQKFVRSGVYRDTAPNSPATIQKKSTRQKNKKGIVSDIPLIDSAQMINELTSVINGRSK